MSFTVVGGKIFICEKCKGRLHIDYKGGAGMTQIGDFEVVHQQQIAQELGEQQVIDERGFYLYNFGLCASCYEKFVPETLREKSNRFNEFFSQLNMLYEDTYKKIDEYFPKAIEQVESNLTWDDISKAVGGLDEDELEDKRQHKGKRRSPLKTFIHSYEEVLDHYIINSVLKIPKIDLIMKQYKADSREILRKMIELLKSGNTFYFSKITDTPENLNEYIISNTSVRVPVEGSVSESFYYEMELDCRATIKNYCFGFTDFSLTKGTLSPMIEKALEKKADANQSFA